jgi:hypothetical protein
MSSEKRLHLRLDPHLHRNTHSATTDFLLSARKFGSAIMTLEQSFLFPAEYLKPEDDPDIVARPLHISDYDKGTQSSNGTPLPKDNTHRSHLLMIGYCNLLNQLTALEDVSKERYTQRFREWQAAKDIYFVVVLVYFFSDPLLFCQIPQRVRSLVQRPS